MKKVSLFLVLLAGLICSSFASAATKTPKVDLKPRNAHIETSVDPNSGHNVSFLYVSVQNSGPNDFNGAFTITASNGNSPRKQTFTGEINAGGVAVISIVGSQTSDPYSIFIDSDDNVKETNEDNNYLLFNRDEAQIGIMSGWSILDVQESNDTLYVLPGEYFYSQFNLNEFNGAKSIIGIDYSIYSYNFADDTDIDFDIQRFSENNYSDGSYSYKGIPYYRNYYHDSHLSKTTFTWMANNTTSALNYWWLGSFSGENSSPVVGEVKSIFMNVNVALSTYATTAISATSSRSIGLSRMLKTVDRIRCDVNGDGIVDQSDLDIMMEVVSNGLYNPCQPTPNIYTESGLNYGAGIILFNMPDFVSNCLLNIWLHDQNDPLVQGLGIGKLMSDRYSNKSQIAVKKVKNTFSVSDTELTIDAPEATLYNVTAVDNNGGIFQKTGKIGEKINITDPTLTYNVETVKLVGSSTTAINEVLSTNLPASVYHNLATSELMVKGSGTVNVYNLSGQNICSSKLISDEQLNISTSNWSNGVYLVQVISKTGKTKTTKIMK